MRLRIDTRNVNDESSACLKDKQISFVAEWTEEEFHTACGDFFLFCVF